MSGATVTDRYPGLLVTALQVEHRDDETWLRVRGTSTGGPRTLELPVPDAGFVGLFADHLFADEPVDVTCVWHAVAGYRCALDSVTLSPAAS